MREETGCRSIHFLWEMNMHKFKYPWIPRRVVDSVNTNCKSEVKETSVVSDPICLWCRDRNWSLKNVSDLPSVSARIELEPLLSNFSPYSQISLCRIFQMTPFYLILGIRAGDIIMEVNLKVLLIWQMWKDKKHSVVLLPDLIK